MHLDSPVKLAAEAQTIPDPLKEAVIHYVSWPSQRCSVLSNHVLHDPFQSRSSPQKLNSALSPSRSSHRCNLNILFSLVGARGGGDGGEES